MADAQRPEEQMDSSEVEGGERQSVQERVEETGQKALAAQHAVQSVAHGLKAMVSVIANPIFWAIVVIFAMVLAVFSTIQVIGQNENACLGGVSSGDGGGDGGGAGASNAEAEKSMSIMGTYLTKTNFAFLGNKPFTKEQAAGLLGNAWTESNWQFSITQSHFNDKLSNDEALGMGNTAGKAIGFYQWDVSNRAELAKFAKSHNKNWQDPAIQLAFTKYYLGVVENGLVGNKMKKAGFAAPGKSAHEYTKIAFYAFEGQPSNRTVQPDRYKYAETFMQKFKETTLPNDIPEVDDSKGSSGGGAGGGGGDGGDPAVPAACSSDGSFDNSSIVKLAIGMAWPRDQRANSKVTTMSDGGEAKATPAYVSAKKKAESEGGKDPMNLWADCGRFVATVLRNTVDKQFPWGPTSDQYTYMEQHTELYKKIGHDKKSAQPGDIIIKGGVGGSGHIAIYLGQYQGIDSVADASMADRTGLIGDAGMYNDSMFGNGNRQFDLFRYIGPNSGNVGGAATDGSGTLPGKPTYGSNKWPTSVPKVTGTYQGKDVQQAVKDAMKYGNAALPKPALCTAGLATLRCDAAKKFNEWNEEYKKSHGGANIPVNTSYRDMAWQIQLYQTQPGLTAKPGTSNHGWGLAVDIQVGAMYSPLHNWFVKTAPKYGWQWPASVRPGGRGPDEAWHFEFGTVS